MLDRWPDRNLTLIQITMQWLPQQHRQSATSWPVEGRHVLPNSRSAVPQARVTVAGQRSAFQDAPDLGGARHYGRVLVLLIPLWETVAHITGQGLQR